MQITRDEEKTEYENNKIQFENQRLRFLIDHAREDWVRYGSQKAIKELIHRYVRLNSEQIKEYMLTKESLMNDIYTLFSIKKLGKLVWIKESKDE